MSRQERHDKAAMQAVANEALHLQQNKARDARDVELQGQLLRSIETLSHRMEAVAEANQEQARVTQAGGPGTLEHDLCARRGRSVADCQEQPSPAQPRPA
ncbi:hypothetical protein IscW_ISCW014099 [Ixodes scapularis]|uniref:Uncharacterized protein n=1 Tax=Ixodes scapularis TaxID=6945 RepID=B7QJY7_IXOSC|nr:hypothetical protein IscW_ISCW014099 [Ixodes scapularis]|eukprot:XP_002415494.1 hypothetical protein IscW_ISCW014099 [Ixodes scapularis]